MNVKSGDRIAVEAERVGTPEREGEVLEVISGGVGITYRVRWQDGRETLFSPAAGAIRVMPGRKRPAERKSSAKKPAKAKKK